MAATIEPLHINRECQGLRQQRVATDDCDDPVDRDLAKEIGVIQSSADLMKGEGFLKYDIFNVTTRSKSIFKNLNESYSCESQRADT